MVRRVVPTIILIVVGTFPHVSEAEVTISEIMYDLPGSDTKREWVEIFNAGPNVVDLSTWKLFENDTNHSITHVQGASLLESGKFAIVADDAPTFLADWGSFSTTLFDSSFSLNNTGELLMLRNSEGIDIDSVAYTSAWGAAGNGNSLQKIGNTWKEGAPTPGTENAASTPAPSNEASPTEEKPSGENTVVSESGESFTTEPQIYTDAGGDRTAVMGVPVEFQGQALGLKREPLTQAEFLWNFGDGTTQKGRALFHTYHYPGEYVVFLDVSSGKYAASDRVMVTVVVADVTISYADNERIELSNGTSADLDVSWWILHAQGQSFSLPKGTYILADKQLTFTKEVTGLYGSSNVELLYPNGNVASTYPNDTRTNSNTPAFKGTDSLMAEQNTFPSATSPDLLATQNKVHRVNAVSAQESNEMLQFFDSAQQASLYSGTQSSKEDISNVYKWLLMLVTIVSIGIIGVLLRKNKSVADEYEIVE